MKLKKAAKRITAWGLSLALVVTGSGISTVSAAKKTTRKSITLKVGKTKTLKMTKASKKVKWSTSNKKIVKITKIKGKKKNTAVVKAVKAGTAKVTAKSGSRKMIVKVKVNGNEQPGATTSAPSGTPGTQPTPRPSGSPSASTTASPMPTGTASGDNNPTDPGTGGGSTDPGTGGGSTDPGTGGGSTDPGAGGGSTDPGTGLTSSQKVPAASADDTLTVGNIAVTLGMSKSEVETAAGAAPNRKETSPLGFDVYIYNPSNDYTNYLMLQFDGDKLVGMTTLSAYFTYEDKLTSGTDTSTTLSNKGFSGISGDYDYKQGYLYTGDHEYVLAFIDHQGSKNLYAVEIFAKQTSKNPSGETNLKNLFRAENCTYNDTINGYMAQQLFDWACAFRASKGLTLFVADGKNGAQKHSNDMAANNFVSESSSNGTGRTDRFRAEYGDYYVSFECVASRSSDAFAFVTWILDDSDTPKTYKNLTMAVDDKYQEPVDPYYLNAGFSSSSTGDRTYAALDLYFY